MNVLIVVNHARDWPCAVAGASVISARDYLTDAAFGETQPARVINLCRTERYQGRGYYVSMLAEAQGHHPLPELKTLGDLHAESPETMLAGLAQEQIQRALAGADADIVTLDAWFGRDPQRKHDGLAQRIFAQVRVPLLRVTFARVAAARDGARGGEHWRVQRVKALSALDVPPELRPLASEIAADFIARKTPVREARAPGRPRLGILHNPDTPDAPSNRAALDKFVRAAANLGMDAELLSKDDIERLPALDGLFIRDTTWVNHYTYQFARRAVAEGLIVVDDPESILRCTNKVYLNALLSRHRVPMPRTLMVHRENVAQILPALGLPCILKKPDGAFSIGVAKIETAEQLYTTLDQLFTQSDLVIAQEWLPTTFDWRVGIFDRRPLFVCKYFMAPGHWQVIKRESGAREEGRTATLTVGEAPELVVKTALKAANLIGDGLYGVDLKEANGQVFVIEVNDNPNVDAGNEDAVLGDALYREIVGVFLRRINERAGSAPADARSAAGAQGNKGALAA
jgi:glutathione synthase/RimK-type ligase-like ATP-grasp enzyme